MPGSPGGTLPAKGIATANRSTERLYARSRVPHSERLGHPPVAVPFRPPELYASATPPGHQGKVIRNHGAISITYASVFFEMASSAVEVRVPLKWQKYLVLVAAGLANLEDIERDVVRVPWDERSLLAVRIASEMASADPRVRSLYVVKAVPLTAVGQLRNYRIESPSDISGLEAFFASVTERCVEAWFCRTRIDSRVLSVAGRIAFHAYTDQFGQTVEQVWRCSPRMIESLDADFAYPYVRASRPGWCRSYRVLHTHSRGLHLSQLLAEFNDAMLLIEAVRERLQPFCDELEEASLGSYSLEYKIVGRRLNIIDWDTPNDYQVLRRL